MNEQGLGKNQRKALEFISRVNGWHTFAKDVAPVVHSLERRGLVQVNEHSQFRLTIRIKCDQCQMLSINGVGCHETGCPNTNSRWDENSGEWIKQRKCGECGLTVDATDPCCSAPFESEEE